MADNDKKVVALGSQLAEVEVEVKKEETSSAVAPVFSSPMMAVLRIKTKYLRWRKAQRGSSHAAPGGPGFLPSEPQVFKFDGETQCKSPVRRRPKRRSGVVLFPYNSPKFLPKNTDQSRTKPFLALFSIIVSLQVYNAIENLDDHVLKYDMEGLEKTLAREMYGQQREVEELMEHLVDYLSTYIHPRPLVLSLHGPSGVGKSHLGRVLARHFRSVVGQDLLEHYFTLHMCPLVENQESCATELVSRVAEVVSQAEQLECIPVFILDEVEAMHGPMLDALQKLFGPDQSHEFQNAIYVLLSRLGESELTSHVLQNSTTAGAQPLLRRVLTQHHPLWAEEGGVEVLGLSLLERSHVTQCILEEMTRKGFYPDQAHVERLAAELPYHSVGGRQYAQTGCKQVAAMINPL